MNTDGANGVFNFEGGCYAKLIDLSEEDEPAIFGTTRRFGTVLENIVLDDAGVPDFHDTSKTQNTRGSYPIEFIDNRTADSRRSPSERHFPDLRCLWRSSAHFPTHARASRLPLHFRIHRQGRRDRGRRERAPSHLLGVLW